MFGMGFGEIILVVIVAIIFLGPEKLPQTMVDIAKFFRAFKKTIREAKENLDREINISEIKQEALSYKKSLETGTESLTKGLSLDDLNPILDSSPSKESAPKNSAQDSSPKVEKPAQDGEIDFKSATRAGLDSKPQESKES